MALLIKNIKSLIQVEDDPKKMVSGNEMAQLPSIENAFLLVKHGKIQDFGQMKNSPESAGEVVDATGKYVLPCWVDSHTHLVHATSREEEWVMRIEGKSYEEIAEAGGGILNSARKLQAKPEEELYNDAVVRLNNLIKLGTGAIEIKSGYGLTVEAELKMLRVIKQLKENFDLPIRANFLGAHAFPMEFRSAHEGYIKLIVEEMLPQIAREGLADFIDTFCETGFFSPEETDYILKVGIKHGLRPKIHANQLAVSGGVQVGVANNAISVDHLEQITDDEIQVLIDSETMPTALPACSFFLGIPYAPARQMIDAGLPMAIASDFNPGSSPTGNMNLVVSLASINMKMLPAEAINAATINTAYAMGVEDQVGSICRGKQANFFITNPIKSLEFMPYAFGDSLVEDVYINGHRFEA